MGLKFSNFELQMLCVMNCKKITKCIGNQQCNKHLHFPGQHYNFQRVFKTFPYLRSFSRLFKAMKISTLNSRTFHTFPGSVRTLITSPKHQRFNGSYSTKWPLVNQQQNNQQMTAIELVWCCKSELRSSDLSSIDLFLSYQTDSMNSRTI